MGDILISGHRLTCGLFALAEAVSYAIRRKKAKNPDYQVPFTQVPERVQQVRGPDVQGSAPGTVWFPLSVDLRRMLAEALRADEGYQHGFRNNIMAAWYTPPPRVIGAYSNPDYPEAFLRANEVRLRVLRDRFRTLFPENQISEEASGIQEPSVDAGDVDKLLEQLTTVMSGDVTVDSITAVMNAIYQPPTDHNDTSALMRACKTYAEAFAKGDFAQFGEVACTKRDEYVEQWFFQAVVTHMQQANRPDDVEKAQWVGFARCRSWVHGTSDLADNVRQLMLLPEWKDLYQSYTEFIARKEVMLHDHEIRTLAKRWGVYVEIRVVGKNGGFTVPGVNPEAPTKVYLRHKPLHWEVLVPDVQQHVCDAEMAMPDVQPHQGAPGFPVPSISSGISGSQLPARSKTARVGVHLQNTYKVAAAAAIKTLDSSRLSLTDSDVMGLDAKRQALLAELAHKRKLYEDFIYAIDHRQETQRSEITKLRELEKQEVAYMASIQEVKDQLAQQQLDKSSEEDKDGSEKDPLEDIAAFAATDVRASVSQKYANKAARQKAIEGGNQLKLALAAEKKYEQDQQKILDGFLAHYNTLKASKAAKDTEAQTKRAAHDSAIKSAEALKGPLATENENLTAAKADVAEKIQAIKDGAEKYKADMEKGVINVTVHTVGGPYGQSGAFIQVNDETIYAKKKGYPRGLFFAFINRRTGEVVDSYVFDTWHMPNAGSKECVAKELEARESEKDLILIITTVDASARIARDTDAAEDKRLCKALKSWGANSYAKVRGRDIWMLFADRAADVKKEYWTSVPGDGSLKPKDQCFISTGPKQYITAAFETESNAREDAKRAAEERQHAVEAKIRSLQASIKSFEAQAKEAEDARIRAEEEAKQLQSEMEAHDRDKIKPYQNDIAACKARQKALEEKIANIAQGVSNQAVTEPIVSTSKPAKQISDDEAKSLREKLTKLEASLSVLQGKMIKCRETLRHLVAPQGASSAVPIIGAVIQGDIDAVQQIVDVMMRHEQYKNCVNAVQQIINEMTYEACKKDGAKACVDAVQQIIGVMEEKQYKNCISSVQYAIDTMARAKYKKKGAEASIDAIHQFIGMMTYEQCKKYSTEACINATDEYGWTALHVAVARAELIGLKAAKEMIRALLCAGARIDSLTPQSMAPHEVATCDEIAQFVLDTALSTYARRGDPADKPAHECDSLLLCHYALVCGADPNTAVSISADCQDKHGENQKRDVGRTPLGWALVSQRSRHIVELLLNSKADPMKKDREDMTPVAELERVAERLGEKTATVFKSLLESAQTAHQEDVATVNQESTQPE